MENLVLTCKSGVHTHHIIFCSSPRYFERGAPNEQPKHVSTPQFGRVALQLGCSQFSMLIKYKNVCRYNSFVALTLETFLRSQSNRSNINQKFSPHPTAGPTLHNLQPSYKTDNQDYTRQTVGCTLVGWQRHQWHWIQLVPAEGISKIGLTSIQ